MREYYTLGIVLGSRPSDVSDRMVDLYTKDLGRLQAKVVAGRKLTSKLSPHLSPGNLVEVRLVEKVKFIVADAVIKERFIRSHEALEFLFLLRSLLPEFVPDLQIWHHLVRSLKERKVKNSVILKFLGYNPLLARCEFCSQKNVAYFSITNQVFLCRRCAASSPADVVLIT